jgi:hypothetical protein
VKADTYSDALRSRGLEESRRNNFPKNL